jgi:hypothetical protein
MNRERDAHDNFPPLVPVASGRRLSSQIGRAFRGTFGATTGLRTLMQSIAEQMLAGGVTQQDIAQAFETCVMQHPARIGCDSQSLISGKAYSAVLVELASECVAAASLRGAGGRRRAGGDAPATGPSDSL